MSEQGHPGVGAILPGLLVLAGFALLAQVVADTVPIANALVLAVVFGAVASNLVGTPMWASAGVDQHKLLLETGIVLLGARIALGDVVSSGPLLLGLVVATVAFGVVAVELLARYVFRLRRRAGSLLAAGSSICGVSAVVAVAGVVDADGEDITYAAATVLLFDAVTLVAFPPLGHALGLTGQEFGIWAGLAMFSTGPVAAAGFAHSAVAGQWATLTKLLRNSLIGVLAVGYSLAYAHEAESVGSRAVWSRFPKFLLGFLVVAAVANTGVLSSAALETLGTVSDWLFALAFVGLGFDIRLSRMRDSGLAPIAVVLAYLAAVSTLTLLAVTALF